MSLLSPWYYFVLFVVTVSVKSGPHYFFSMWLWVLHAGQLLVSVDLGE